MEFHWKGCLCLSFKVTVTLIRPCGRDQNRKLNIYLWTPSQPPTPTLDFHVNHWQNGGGLKSPKKFYGQPITFVSQQFQASNHVPWRAESMQVFIPTNHYTSWFHKLTHLQPERRELIDEISWCSDWLEWKPAYSRPSMAHDWAPLN